MKGLIKMKNNSPIVEALDLNGATNVKLIRCDVYKDAETDEWLMSAEYEFDTEAGLKKRLEIPAMSLPIPRDHFPIFEHGLAYHSLDYVPYISPNDMYLRLGVIHKTDGTPVVRSDGRCARAFTATKIIPADMTKSEIEKKLGYPINIIKED